MLALPRTATETVIQNKKVIWWEPKPRYTTLRETIFLLPAKGAGGVFIQTSGFIDTFGRRKTAPKQPKIWLKLYEKLVSPFR